MTADGLFKMPEDQRRGVCMKQSDSQAAGDLVEVVTRRLIRAAATPAP